MQLKLQRGSGLPPLRTFRELADRIDVSTDKLTGILCHEKDAPKPVRSCRSNLMPGRTYYNPIEFLAWWDRYQARKREQAA